MYDGACTTKNNVEKKFAPPLGEAVISLQRESGEEKTGGASQGMAVEQLVVLYEEGNGFD